MGQILIGRMNFVNRLSKPSMAIARNFGTSSAAKSGEVPVGFKNLKTHQRDFNIDNGLRVHERGGAKDRVLMMASQALLLLEELSGSKPCTRWPSLSLFKILDQI